MPKSRSKKKYKKKKNPNRAPQQQKQTSAARTQSAKSGGSAKPAADPNRQKQMWIAVAVAVGVFLLLLLIAQFTNKGNKDTASASPDAETAEQAGDAAESVDGITDANAESGTETEADGSAETDTDSADKSAETDADGGKTDTAATSDSGNSATTDDGKTDNATTTTDNAATTTDSGKTDNAAATTTDNTAATSDNTTTTADNNSATTDSGKTDTAATTTDTAAATAADADAPAAVQYADIVVQDYGKITVELDASTAPITVQNFVDLAKSGFYNGLTFHRIMNGFMAQGGDPLGNGTGGSDKNIVGEFSSNGHTNNISHTRGTISMARASGDKNSASSQFFIVQSDSTFLDGDYAAFGHVTDGMEVVDKICEDAKPTDGNGTIAPEEQPIIESITIRDK